MRELNVPDEESYLKYIQDDLTGRELRRFINAITTNTTSFFRTPEHFGSLRKHVIEWDKNGGRRYRVWCSASSTGEEPWSIAMLIARWIPDWVRKDVRVLATDIDTDVLAQARAARYREKTLVTVPPDYRTNFFSASGVEDEEAMFSIRAELRGMVNFARLNLSQLPYPMKGPFDVIFCRNVLIYFDQDVRLKVLTAMIGMLEPDGLLILGPSESAMGLEHLLRRTTDSVYMLRQDP
jgi:chemotaxis protein methyltransferase CheR